MLTVNLAVALLTLKRQSARWAGHIGGTSSRDLLGTDENR